MLFSFSVCGAIAPHTFFMWVVILKSNIMTIYELISEIQTLALQHKQLVAAQCGNTFDVATSKSSETYPALWIELPILTRYVDRRKKTHSFALNFLSLCKADDLEDAINKTSDMEVIADEFLQALDDRFKNIGVDDITALTLRGFSDDDLVGVRVEITFVMGRECDYKEDFDVQA